MESSIQAFDYSKIIATRESKEISIDFEGTTYKFKIRDLTWAERNLIISRSATFKVNGMSIDLDFYFRNALQEMIVEAPWPKEKTTLVLRDLNSKFGELLQAFVPSPFESTNKGVDEEEAKK